MGDTPKQWPGNNKRKTFKMSTSIPHSREQRNRNTNTIPGLNVNGRSDNIGWFVQPGYLFVYLFSNGLQCFTRSLFKAARATLYRKRTAIYGKVYLAKFIPVRPALLFEVDFRSRNILVTTVEVYQFVSYCIHYLFCYAAMRHMKFYIHKLYFCTFIVCKQPSAQYVFAAGYTNVMFL